MIVGRRCLDFGIVFLEVWWPSSGGFHRHHIEPGREAGCISHRRGTSYGPRNDIESANIVV